MPMKLVNENGSKQPVHCCQNGVRESGFVLKVQEASWIKKSLSRLEMLYLKYGWVDAT